MDLAQGASVIRLSGRTYLERKAKWRKSVQMLARAKGQG